MAVVFGDQIDAKEILATHGDLQLATTEGTREVKTVEEKNEYA